MTTTYEVHKLMIKKALELKIFQKQNQPNQMNFKITEILLIINNCKLVCT